MTAGIDRELPADTIEIERHIAAPPDVVFPFFTDPDRYVMWQGVGVELDARAGGLFRVRMNDEGDIARGEFVEIDPPHRLVLSWGWEGMDALPPGASTVEVLLTAEAGGTLVRIRHSGLKTEFGRDVHSFGWAVGLDQLVRVATTAGTGK